MGVRVVARAAEGVLAEHYRYPPGRAVTLARHAHAEYQFNLNLGEPGGLHHRGAFHVVPPGGLVVVPPGEEHTPRDPADRAGWSEHLTLYLDPAVLDGRRPVLGGLEVTAGPVRRAFRRAHLAAMDDAVPRLARNAALLELVRAVAPQAREDVPARGRERPAVRRAQEYLHAHAGEQVSLETLGRVAGLSPSHLTREFTAATGMPPHAYQIALRVNLAKLRLLAGRTPTAAAAEAGFFDLSHLTRHFRRIVGVPPGAYRGEFPEPP